MRELERALLEGAVALSLELDAKRQVSGSETHQLFGIASSHGASSEGVRFVLVNGRLVVREGELLPVVAGLLCGRRSTSEATLRLAAQRGVAPATQLRPDAPAPTQVTRANTLSSGRSRSNGRITRDCERATVRVGQHAAGNVPSR
jgi:hypothetical protein